MRRIRGPSLSATKFFLRDSKQPPVNSGREFQPVSERRHIRLVLDKCSDWYPIQFVQTNYSAPTEHISFVRLFIYRANFLIEWFIINILAAHDLPPNHCKECLIYKSKIEKNYLQLFAAFVRACVTAFCSSASPQFLP